MKIAMIGQKRIPSREGGVEIVVEELSTRMVEKGHQVTCYNRGGKHVLDKNQNLKKLKEYKGVKLKKVITIDKKGLAAMTSSFFGTLKILFSKAKVVHYHAEGPCAWLWIIKFFSRKRIIVTIHGLDWQRAKWGGFATKYIKFGEKMATKYAHEIIVLSKNVQDYFLKEYNRKTIFIPNGVNKPKIIKSKIIKDKFNIDKDEYILFLGRIVPEKGIHYLIDAFKNIKTDKKLVIAGGASDTDSYFTELKDKVSTMQESISYYKSLEDGVNKTIENAQTTADELKKAAEKEIAMIKKESKIEVQKELDNIKEEILKKQVELEETKKQIKIYKIKEKAMLEAQLKILNEMDE